MSNQIISAKDYLSRAYRIDQRINSKLEQMLSLRSLAEKAAPVLTGMPKGKGSDPHQMESTIAKIVDLEALIDKDLKRLVDTKHEIITVIKCVEPVELQTLLELRYLSFKTWEQIAVEMNFDRRHVTRLHGKALLEVEVIRRI
jgi:hypothetical protein